MKKTLALLLVLAMVVAAFAGCSKKPADSTTPSTDSTKSTEPSTTTPAADATYTYKDSVSTLCANWNPHTYQVQDDAYLSDFIRTGLYGFFYNDASHPIEGTEDYAGYVIVPEMAESDPVDVTEQVKAEHPEFNIPESATAGYAYTIDLNKNACWEDGTPITADDYIESMKRLLDPTLLNYRATDYYSGALCIAGAEAYAKGGTTTYEYNTYGIDELTLGDDGQYVDPDGKKVFIAVNVTCKQLDGDLLGEYIEEYGDQYFDTSKWETIANATTEDGVAPLTDETLDALTTTITGNPAWGEQDGTSLPDYLVYANDWAVTDYSTVGCYKTGDYQITLVLGKALAGFNLFYNLSSNWLVKTDLYDSCITETNGVKTSNYNTSVETTVSYGPYKLTSFQSGKALSLEKNDKWYGYTDGKHTYVDPADGQTYDMYQTTNITCEEVAEASTQKMMFLKGELATYGLQADDFATYRQSEYNHVVPAETIFFLILNGNMSAIEEREAAADFDQNTTDLQTMTLQSFRKAMAVTFDKELFAATISPARSGGYGIIGTTYVYDPETGATYRSTEQAKKVLCDFYSVDTSKFASLDDAVASITGYDPEAAKELFTEAYKEAIEAGYITDSNGDGISDQTVTIVYTLSADNDFITKTLDYLNEKLAEVTAGTPFEGKIMFTKSPAYGNDWSTMLKNGMSDTCLAGWNGSKFDPFGLSDLYVNPTYQYDAGWFDATTVDLTLTVPVDGKDTELTMNMREWSDALNGATVTVDGTDYCFGEGIADVETRLTILAGIEGKVLETYDYLPMLQNAGQQLLSQQMFYVTDEYNAMLGYGGLAYTKYNYTDAEWTAYVAEQGGELKY